MSKKGLKALFVLPILIMVSLATTQCGFTFTQPWLSTYYKKVYIASDQPYDKFIILLKQNFKSMRVTLADNQQNAPITIRIIESKLTHSAPDITTSDKARIYELTYQVSFALEGPEGQVFLPAQGLVLNKKMTLNPGQTLYSNDEINVIKQEMQREALILLLYRLQTQKVRDILR